MLNKNAISVFFALFFLFSVISPSISMLIGFDDDVICFVDMNELEGKEKEPTNDKENKILDLSNSSLTLIDFKSLTLAEYFFNKYATPHLNLVSPPPEVII